MKNKFVARILSMILAVVLICSFSTTVFAATGTVNWNGNDGTSYAAVVTRDSNKTNMRSVAISDSTVRIAKGGKYSFGGCTYNVKFSNTLWTNYTTRLNNAGQKVGVSSSYNEDVYFRNTYSFTASNYSGSYCATTNGYGYSGSFYVQKLTQTPVNVYAGDFSFAPCGCSNVITSVIDVNFA